MTIVFCIGTVDGNVKTLRSKIEVNFDPQNVKYEEYKMEISHRQYPHVNNGVPAVFDEHTLYGANITERSTTSATVIILLRNNNLL